MLFPRLLFVFLLGVAGFAQAGGQVNIWTPRGPEGGVVGRPVIDPQSPGTLYVNASHGRPRMRRHVVNGDHLT